MPLLDHFRPPLSAARHWESFHAAWAGTIADSLNMDLLPTGYFAEEHVHVGSRVEIDVATFDSRADSGAHASGSGGAVAVAAPTWAPPAPTMVWPAVFPDSLEVLIYSGEAGPTLVAAIELVSPGNKDRSEVRGAFAAKCAAYLQQGVGLIVVDIVTSRRANLHAELGELIGAAASPVVIDDLYACAYRPSRLPEGDRIDVWTMPLSIGRPLPVLGLPLRSDLTLPLDLDASYAEACRRRRIVG